MGEDFAVPEIVVTSYPNLNKAHRCRRRFLLKEAQIIHTKKRLIDEVYLSGHIRCYELLREVMTLGVGPPCNKLH